MDLARIDKKISRQKAITRNLYVQRNSLVPISRLSTEVLESIFMQLACHYFYCHGTPDVPEWFHISHVSSRWRYVALNCPLLWSHITPGSQRWVDALLERSNQAPLKIRIDLREGRDEYRTLSPFFEKILQHAERIKELNFYTFFWNKQTSQYFDMLYPSIPNLRVLGFSMRHGSWRPSSIRAEPFPSLHHFSKLGSLTTLSLRFTDSHPSFQYNVLGFQAVLHYMPDLVNLYLDHSLASANDSISSTDFDALQKIDLPHLSRLMVNAPLSTITAFLSSISIPVRTQIRLDSSCKNLQSLDNYGLFCSALAQHYSNDRVSSLPVLHFVAMNLNHRILNGRSFIFSMSPNCEIPLGSLSPDNWPSHVLLEIDIRPPKSSDTSVLGSSLCAFMPTTNVQTLHITGPPAHQAFWKETLGHFPGLRRIKINHGSMGDDLVSSLLPHTTDENQGGRARESALEELTLDNMEFQVPGGHWKGSQWLPIGGTNLNLPPYQGLESLCSALPNHAAPQGRLTITKGCVSKYEDSYDMIGKWEGGHFYIVRERIWSSKGWDGDSSQAHDWIV